MPDEKDLGVEHKPTDPGKPEPDAQTLDGDEPPEFAPPPPSPPAPPPPPR